MTDTGGLSAPSALPSPRRRPHPRLDSAKRSWYFFRRNTLAMIGLAVLVGLGAVAAYAYTQPLPWEEMSLYCGANYGPANPASGYPGNFNNSSTQGCPTICTYTVTPPPDASAVCGGQWFKTPGTKDDSFAGMIAPTWTSSPLGSGPLPMGSLPESSIYSPTVYSISEGLLRGSDWSLLFSVSIVGIGAMAGLLVGAVAGFYGGLIDDALMRLVDIFLSIPVILFVVVVVIVTELSVHSIFGLGSDYTKLLMVILGFAAVWWPFYARLVRGQVLVVREQKFIEASFASGASRPRTLVKHIIPNSVYPIFIQFSLDVGTIPLLIGSLAFLGFGPELFPSVGVFPEWGNIAANSVGQIQTILGTCQDITGCTIPWWQLFFPGLMLFMFAISVNLLSDGMRDAFDPRLRR